MSYNFPPPRRRKPSRWGFLLLLLVGGGVVFYRLPAKWPSALPDAVEKWRQKTLASTPKPQKSESNETTPAAPTRPLPKQEELAAPQVTPPPVSQPEREADTEITPSNLPPRLPGAPVVREVSDARVRQLEAKIAKYPVFALYRELAQRHLALGNTEAAAGVFRTQAALYRRKGMEDAALILEKQAAQTETTIRVFAARAGGETPFTNAPLEPRRGCYLGAFIDRDDALLTRFNGDNWQHHRLPSEFEARVGRRHASVFTYVKWGNFPRQWLQMCKREGVIPHIAWEPQNLREVQNDAYLRSCAQFLRELDWPVFVRFAGEMNGDWTPYHGDPALYREKFRLVHRTLHRYATKVATIWCVNAIPSDNIVSYYPGDDGCDWVGVNLYSTPFADNDRTRQAFGESPLTLLEPIYRRYSTKKPIAICEYAASHQSAVDGVVRTSFAIEKMSLLYGALPLLYPRVKMINWFSTNNLIHARAGRQLNNYRLTQHPAVQEAYRNLTASPHFLTSLQGQGTTSAPLPREIGAGEKVRANERLTLWVTSTSARPAVFVQAANRVVYGGRRVGKHVIELELPAKADSLSILVYDQRGRCVKRRDVKLYSS
ncbi:MAG: hypothetical protein KY445_10720 [Armatimonadetes bacterium]|nr:hypothetical protein [Armatimonadota bacterium]